MNTEQLIEKFGEEHRELIKSAIAFLEREPLGKEANFSREEYIRSVLDKISPLEKGH